MEIKNIQNEKYKDIVNQNKFGITRNVNPYRRKIKKGEELSTEALVNIFGSPQQKRTYKKTNKLPKNTKDSIIRKALQYCKIEDTGNGTYRINKILNYDIGGKIVKYIYAERTENNIFNIILLKVIVYNILMNANDNNCLSFRLKQYAEQFSLINSYYQGFKKINNDIKKKTLIESGISEISLTDFYNNVDESIDNCILNVLKVLEDIKAITVTKNLLLLTKVNEAGKPYKVRATEEEEGKIASRIDTFMNLYNVKYSDLFYKKKIIEKFDKFMYPTLKKIGAINWYRTFEVFIINSTLLGYLLDYVEFNVEDLPAYYLTLNYLFADKMLKNATNRTEKRLLEKIKSSGNVEQYLKENHINIENLTKKNFRDIIPVEYIEKEKEEMIEITKIKDEKRDYTKLSQTYIPEEETKKISDLVLRIKANEYGEFEPLIPLFCLNIDNSKEYEPIDKEFPTMDEKIIKKKDKKKDNIDDNKKIKK